MAIETGPKPENLSGANGAEPPAPRRSLREVAEESYDQIESGVPGPDEGDDGAQQPVDDSGIKRDAHGRFAPKGEESGEAAAARPPSPETDSAPQPETATQPLAGEAAAAPANWSEADRQAFAKLPQEGQAFLLRRHSEMEGDYQRRVQAIGAADQFTRALQPIFQDPVLGGHLQQSGMGPYEAIQQWAGMHRRALHPDPRERVNLLVEMAANMGLNPATLFATSRQEIPGLSEADQKDPAIRHFADTLGRTSTEVQALRSQVQQLVQGSAQQAAEQQLRVTRWGIDSFADEKDAQGNLLHPHFDAVLPQVIELFKANPERDLREAYETALWMAPDTRKAQLEAAERQRQQKQSNDRAAQAVRSNVRGRTVPVTGKPPADPNAKRSLRDVIESSADEVGF